MSIAPTKVPKTDPLPPKRLVPPITTAAMVYNSIPSAIKALAEFIRPTKTNPPSPQ